jgi:hypothetical protein
MSDTDTKQAEQAAPRKRGRPRKKVGRGPLREPRMSMRQEQERESQLMEGFAYQPFENVNPLHIDMEVLRAIEHEYGYRLQWNCETVLGQPQEAAMSSHRRNGFQEVRKGSFGGILDFLCDREGRITKDGVVLMARPAQIDDLAKTYERKAARRAVEDMKRKHSDEGISGVTMPGGNKEARQHNRHGSSFERAEVPEQ